MAVPNFGIFALLFGLLSGGASDLLDFVPTEAYWTAKGVTVSVEQLVGELKAEAPVEVAQLIRALGSGNYAEREEAARKIRASGPAAIPSLERAADDPDPEVANRVRSLVQEIQRASRGAAVRKLMAIRTLGERRHAQGLPVLKPLLTASEPFVADYAAGAIARIEGKPLPPRGPSPEALKADLGLLPANCGVVGQVSLASARPVSMDQLARDVPPLPGENRQQTLDTLTSAVIGVAEQVGNVRVEAVTFGVADDVGPNTGFVVAVVRGKWDAQAIQGAVRPIFKTWNAVEGVDVAAPEKSSALAVASNERFIAWAGPSQDKLPVKDMLAAAREGKVRAPADPDLARLIAAVDPRATGWAVCKVGPAYRVAPVVGGFDTLTLVTRPEADGMDLRLTATGSDAGQVKNAVDTVNQQLATAKMEIPKAAEQMPLLKPIARFVQGLTCEVDGRNATLTGHYDGEPGTFLAVPFMLMSRGAAAPVAPPPAAVRQPAQPPQPAEQIEEPKK